MQFIDKIFDLCVKFLQELASLTGTTYKFVNVIIFCVLGPIIFILLILRNKSLNREMKRYKVLYEKFVSSDINNRE